MSLKEKERFKCAGTVNIQSIKPGAGTTFYLIWTEYHLAEVGLALKSHLLAPRASLQRRWKTLL